MTSKMRMRSNFFCISSRIDPGLFYEVYMIDLIDNEGSNMVQQPLV